MKTLLQLNSFEDFRTEFEFDLLMFGRMGEDRARIEHCGGSWARSDSFWSGFKVLIYKVAQSQLTENVFTYFGCKGSITSLFRLTDFRATLFLSSHLRKTH
jgi:hypothetical protein